MRGYLKLAALIAVFVVLAGVVGTGSYAIYVINLSNNAFGNPDMVRAEKEFSPQQPSFFQAWFVGGTEPYNRATDPDTGKPVTLDKIREIEHKIATKAYGTSSGQSPSHGESLP